MPRPTKSAVNRSPFAQRLEAARVMTGMDQEEFASAIGLKAETYRRYERAETEPNIQTLAKIRQITGASLNFIICGDREKPIREPIINHPNVKKTA